VPRPPTTTTPRRAARARAAVPAGQRRAGSCLRDAIQQRAQPRSPHPFAVSSRGVRDAHEVAGMSDPDSGGLVELYALGAPSQVGVIRAFAGAPRSTAATAPMMMSGVRAPASHRRARIVSSLLALGSTRASLCVGDSSSWSSTDSPKLGSRCERWMTKSRLEASASLRRLESDGSRAPVSRPGNRLAGMSAAIHCDGYVTSPGPSSIGDSPPGRLPPRKPVRRG
jgi:hypothetical protein